MSIYHSVVSAYSTNCYFLVDDHTCEVAVIDPGDSPDKLSAFIAKSNWSVRYILLTHGHRDHVSAVPALKALFPQAEVYIHEADADGSGYFSLPLTELVSDLKFYDEGDVLPFGANQEIEVIATPGHTPGGVSLKVGNSLFTGDTLFAGSMGRTDFPDGDMEKLFASLRHLAALDGDYDVYPGHMDFTRLQHERDHNPYLKAALESRSGMSGQ